ncbi:FAD/NAD(P)-binding domain-containing protein [Patellaria atrata CBS 101060]|uniref:FAD/NAD(P)-binding domain-containing protein n=1 Tax=Patellaria atrata CBS 101060 TaxID=1346257 RepID=A0A9P4SI33_9PEZI|nr:FAD/NAD(P)-binding domain-containing protein [Patellaria atrata CBS 101060]
MSSEKAQPSTRVAVIGAGPLGLCALKNFLEEDFDATIFERRDVLGGLWAYSDDPNITTVSKTTILNISKYRNCFSDFPFDEKYPPYMTQPQFLEYLQDYAQAFNLTSRIQFNTEVLEVKARESKGENQQINQSGWTVKVHHSATSSNTDDSLTEEHYFDKVLICTGKQCQRTPPIISGVGFFGPDRITHASAYKGPESYRGKTVLVLGIGNSAGDISTDLVGIAKDIYVAHRRGAYAIPRITNGKPADQIRNRRLDAILEMLMVVAPGWTDNMMETQLAKLSDSSCPPDPKWRMRPAASRASLQVMLSDTFMPALQRGDVKSVANLKRIVDDKNVELDDGSCIKVDCIIACTGYTTDTSLVTNIRTGALHSENKGGLPRLYQNIFPPAYAHSLAFLDSWQLPTGICEAGDLCCMAITQIWKGASSLPAEEEMNRAIDDHYTWLRKVVPNERNASLYKVHEERWRRFLNDAAGTGVNENLGYGWRGWWYWLKNPSQCNLLMGGVDSPHILRLFDGKRKKWDGAAAAIQAVNDDYERRYGSKASSKIE